MAIFNTQYCGGIIEPVFYWWSPHMTSNTVPAPYAVSAGTYSIGSSGFGYPWQAFDGNANNWWYANDSNINNRWIQFDFQKEVRLKGISIQSQGKQSSDTRFFLKSFRLSLSLDGLEFSNVGDPNEYLIKNGNEVFANESFEFLFPETISCRILRLYDVKGFVSDATPMIPNIQFLKSE